MAGVVEPPPRVAVWGSHITVLSWLRITADTQVHVGPLLLWYAHIVPTAVVTITADFYDGMNTSARQLMRLTNASIIMERFMPPFPVRLENGLFVDVSASTYEVLVLFTPLRPEE